MEVDVQPCRGRVREDHGVQRRLGAVTSLGLRLEPERLEAGQDRARIARPPARALKYRRPSGTTSSPPRTTATLRVGAIARSTESLARSTVSPAAPA